jgi:hypothetical protein
MPAPLVEVVGLKAFQRDLRKLSDPTAGDLAKVLVQAGRDALTPIAYQVRDAYPAITGTLRGTVRITSSRTGAAIRVGSKKVPYAGPVDFGGYPQGRPFYKDGRYLYPTAKPLAGVAQRLYERDITEALNDYGWTNTTTSPGQVHD